MGEGGGQVLRTALSLSLITGQPFRIDNIRANRSKPGLLRQHYTAANAAAQIGCAQVEGLAVGSRGISFRPQIILGGDYEFAVGTAGSVHLVLQTVLPALLKANKPSTVTIEGGTHNPFAPPFEFVEKTFLPALKQMGGTANIQLNRHGFYPGGGGKITAAIEPVKDFKRIDFTAPVKIEQVRATAHYAKIRRSIADRETATMCKRLKRQPDRIKVVEVQDTVSPGNYVTIEIRTNGLTEVVTGFGSIGVKAETVAKRVAGTAQKFIDAEIPVGEHLADQLLLPMAIGKGGCFHTTEPSLHFLTNIEVIQKFLDVEIKITKVTPSIWKVDVTFQNKE